MQRVTLSSMLAGIGRFFVIWAFWASCGPGRRDPTELGEVMLELSPLLPLVVLSRFVAVELTPLGLFVRPVWELVEGLWGLGVLMPPRWECERGTTLDIWESDYLRDVVCIC